MSTSERDNILTQLRGQKVRIPDLHPIFSAWPEDVNKHVLNIVPAINKVIERYFSVLYLDPMVVL
jgi:hypothetical protein